MDIKKLWQNNKFLFFLLLPLVLLVVFKDLIWDFLVGSARKKVRETEKKDEELKQKADEANAKADELKDQADQLGEDVKNVKGDPNWHKKRRD